MCNNDLVRDFENCLLRENGFIVIWLDHCMSFLAEFFSSRKFIHIHTHTERIRRRRRKDEEKKYRRRKEFLTFIALPNGSFGLHIFLHKDGLLLREFFSWKISAYHKIFSHGIEKFLINPKRSKRFWFLRWIDFLWFFL